MSDSECHVCLLRDVAKSEGVMLRQIEKIELSVVLGTNHEEQKVTVYRPIVRPGQVAGEASAFKEARVHLEPSKARVL